jgi:hypothetical protein
MSAISIPKQKGQKINKWDKKLKEAFQGLQKYKVIIIEKKETP